MKTLIRGLTGQKAAGCPLHSCQFLITLQPLGTKLLEPTPHGRRAQGAPLQLRVGGGGGNGGGAGLWSEMGDSDN